MNKRSNLKLLLFIVLIYLLLFQNIIQSFIKPFQFFDEIIALCSIPIFILYLLKTKTKNQYAIKKYNLWLIIVFIILLGAGLISTIIYKYQPFKIALSDMLLVSKFFLVYLLSQLLFSEDIILNNSKKIEKNVKFIIILFALLSVVNYLFKLWPNESYRFGIMTNQLFYSHPTVLASVCIFLMSLLILSNNNKKLPIVYLTISILILVSTLRFKAIGASIVIVVIMVYLYKVDKKLSITKLGLFAVTAILVAWNQISYYYIDLDGSARKVLNQKSIEIAKDYFPIGTGFATYGSYFSSVNYSPIYMKYGINNIYGIAKNNSSFVNDTFWPMIIGQFGATGLLCYIILIYIIYIKIQSNYSIKKKNIYVAQIICLIYLTISSTSEAAFVNPLAIPLAIIIGINIKKRDELNE